MTVIVEIEDFDLYDEDDFCDRCSNKGYIVVCIDDLCANNDHCIHGDGEAICPNCEGFYL